LIQIEQAGKGGTTMSSVLTIHSMDPILSGRISALARREGKSLNQTVKDALAEHFGLKQKRGGQLRDNGIMSLCGILSHNDAEELRKAQEPFRTIDPEDWK
jgi:hypothetical protein